MRSVLEWLENKGDEMGRLTACSLGILFYVVLGLTLNANAEKTNGDVTDSQTGMQFVYVPSGSFEMGCGIWTKYCDKDEFPVHKVSLSGFWIGKFEVTQSQWESIMHNNPSNFKRGGNYPVEKVSWYDVQQFIAILNKSNVHKFRLPTEAEWEYAARSCGKKEMYAGTKSLNRIAWYLDNAAYSTHPVGTKEPNELGIYDMTGNVWEWVEDVKGAYPSAPVADPVMTVGSLSRVFRGGSWSYGEQDVRASARGEYVPAGRSSNLGFRLVLIQ